MEKSNIPETTCVVVDEESANKPGDHVIIVFRAHTIAECEQWIEDRKAQEPEKVERGGYGVDGPAE